jgi:hypothetical protein
LIPLQELLQVPLVEPVDVLFDEELLELESVACHGIKLDAKTIPIFAFR